MSEPGSIEKEGQNFFPRAVMRRLRGQPFDLRGIVLPLGLLAAAEILALLFVSPDSYSLAAPHRILVAAVRGLFDGSIPLAALQTLLAAAGGLTLGGILGLVAGIAFGLSPRLDRLMYLSVEALRPVPPAALIPLALLIYGFGFRMEIVIVAYSTVWPILVLSRAAIREIEPGLLDVGRVLQLGAWQRTVKIVLPACLPRFFVAIRLAIAIALIVAVTVEVVVNPIGLGYGMMIATQSLQPDVSFAFLTWIGIVGWVINALLVRVQDKFFGDALNGGVAHG